MDAYNKIRGARPFIQDGEARVREIPAKDFAETMGVEPAAILPFDAALFGQAGNNGQMVLEIAPKVPVSDSLRKLARVLTGREAPASSEKSSSILSFLKSRKQA